MSSLVLGATQVNKMKTRLPEVEVLIPPELPQMAADGVISIQDLAAQNDVLINIQASSHAAKGDFLTLHWSDFQTNTLCVNTDLPSGLFPWLFRLANSPKLCPRLLSLPSQRVWQTVTTASPPHLAGIRHHHLRKSSL
jgi:hypothetical protein